MDLSPYLETLRRDLGAAAATGTDQVRSAADLLAGSLDASARLCLLAALSDAAAEVTARLHHASVEVRLHGRDADLVVTEHADTEPLSGPPEPGPVGATPDAAGDVARITLRLPESLKEQVERAAGAEGISVNAWLVRAVATAVTGRTPPPPGTPFPPFPPGRASFGRRVTGYAKA